MFLSVKDTIRDGGEVAPRYKLLYTAKTLARMPIYIVRKGYNAIGVGRGAMSKMWTGWSG